MTKDELQDQILGYIKEGPRTFFLIEKRFRAQVAPLCKPGRYGSADIRPDLLVHGLLQELRKAGRIHYADHTWRFIK